MGLPDENSRMQILVFTLDAPRYALPVATVRRVIRALQITPLPKAPEIVLGVINLQGQIIPVVDIRKRFRLPERAMEIDDRIIIAQASKRPVGLVVDAVVDVHELATRDIADAGQVLPSAEYVLGVAKVADEMVLINDLDRFLALPEEQTLDAALSEGIR